MNQGVEPGTVPAARAGSDRAQLERGIELAGQRRTREAIEHLKRGRAADPFQSDIQVAHLLCEEGDFDGAAPYVASALAERPDSPTALYLDGLVRRSLGDLEGARESLERAVANGRATAGMRATLADLLHQAGDYTGARRHYEAALELAPAREEFWVGLGLALEKYGNLHRVVDCYRRGIARSGPNASGQLHYRLGNALAEQGWYEAASGAFREAIERGYEPARSWFNLGNAARELGDFDDARDAFEHALALEPGSAESLCNLGVVLEALGDVDGALARYDQGLAMEPGNPVLHWNRGLLLLAAGRFEEGWAGYSRGVAAGKRVARTLPWPEWDGRPLANLTLFVHAEGDISTELLFGSCLPDLARQAATCLVESDDWLAPLLQESLPAAVVLPRSSTWKDPAAALRDRRVDAQISIAATPRYLRKRPEDFPNQGGYLAVTDGSVAAWRARLDQLGPGPKIGISLRGGSLDPDSSRLPEPGPLDLAALNRIAGACLVNLDPASASTDDPLEALNWSLHRQEWLPGDVRDRLSEYAALLLALDAVVATDNLTAHLAGALGAKLLVLVPATADWRWMRDRSISPWFPTARLFRQARSGDWGTAIEDAAGVLTGLAPAPVDSPVQHGPDPAREALFARAVNSQKVGLLDEAARAYRQLIDLDDGDANAWNNLGGVLGQLERPEEAEECLRRAATCAPRNPEILFNLGSLLLDRRKGREAAEFFERALVLRPDFLEAHGRLCTIYKDEYQFRRALKHYSAALEIAPRNLSTRLEYAHLLHHKGPLEESQREFDKCLEQDPACERALLGLSAVVADFNRFDEARAHIETVLAMRPESPLAHSAMARLHHVSGRLDQALDWYRTAQALDPGDVTVKGNMAMVLLAQGDLEQGWEYHEYRPPVGGWRRRGLSAPAWDGSDLAGKTLFVYPEQGLGDEIMFASCYRDLLSMAGRCVIGCGNRLEPLFRRAFPSAQIVPRREGENMAELCEGGVDLEIAAGSVLRFLRPTRESFGDGAPFLSPDAGQSARMRARLDGLGPGLKVGISWHGGGTARARFQRSIGLAELAPVLQVPGVQWVSVQYGSQEQVGPVEEALGVGIHRFDDVDSLRDLEPFSALLRELDLVVTVDNATVHLAGALGAETWMLLPRLSEWRWFQDPELCAWYRSVRFFRQQAFGDWSGVVQRLRSALQARAGGVPR